MKRFPVHEYMCAGNFCTLKLKRRADGFGAKLDAEYCENHILVI